MTPRFGTRSVSAVSSQRSRANWGFLIRGRTNASVCQNSRPGYRTSRSCPPVEESYEGVRLGRSAAFLGDHDLAGPESAPKAHKTTLEELRKEREAAEEKKRQEKETAATVLSAEDIMSRRPSEIIENFNKLTEDENGNQCFCFTKRIYDNFKQEFFNNDFSGNIQDYVDKLNFEESGVEK